VAYVISRMTSDSTIMAPMAQLIGMLMLIVFVPGCQAVLEVRGRSPTDLSTLQVGMAESDVETILGPGIHDTVVTEHGYSEVYRFNRGYLPPDEHKAARAVVLEVINTLSFGSSYMLSAGFQKALLRVEYDKDGRLIHAEESMKVNCNSYYPGGAAGIRHDCFSMQQDHLYPSTLPPPVTKLFQSTTQGDKEALYALKLWRLNKEIRTDCSNADSGNADAQKHIGDLYHFGTDEINIDLIRAYVWYSLAATGGNIEATRQLSLLVDALSPDQSDEALRQLLYWKPGQCERDLKQVIPKGNK
jgi:hypothetical protein